MEEEFGLSEAAVGGIVAGGVAATTGVIVCATATSTAASAAETEGLVATVV